MGWRSISPSAETSSARAGRWSASTVYPRRPVPPSRYPTGLHRCLSRYLGEIGFRVPASVDAPRLFLRTDPPVTADDTYRASRRRCDLRGRCSGTSACSTARGWLSVPYPRSTVSSGQSRRSATATPRNPRSAGSGLQHLARCCVFTTPWRPQQHLLGSWLFRPGTMPDRERRTVPARSGGTEELG
jgi:hypothetical protein